MLLSAKKRISYDLIPLEVRGTIFPSMLINLSYNNFFLHKKKLGDYFFNDIVFTHYGTTLLFDPIIEKMERIVITMFFSYIIPEAVLLRPCMRHKFCIQHLFSYIFWNDRRILMFKVSKWPYRSLLHDRIICKWCQCLLGGQKWN